MNDALSTGAVVHDVFIADAAEEQAVAAARSSGAHVHEVSEQVLRAVSDASTPQGVVAVAELPGTGLDDLDLSSGLILVLAQIRDPGNAGTLIRSASASGAGGIVFTSSSVDPFGPKTLRAAAGAIFRMPVVTKVELDQALSHLRDAGFALIGADAGSVRSVYDVDLTAPTAVVLGNESWGLPDAERVGLDGTAGIPMPGDVESLNVGVAGSLFLFEVARQRQVASKTS